MSIGMNLLVILLLSVLLVSMEACKIVVKIKSTTKNKFQIQLFVPSIKMKTERVEFNGPEEKKVEIAGENCPEKKMIVRTWKPDGAGDWVGAKQEEAKIDGQGWVRLMVMDDLRPVFNDRFGVACSESEYLCG